MNFSLDTDRKLLDDYLKEVALPWKIAFFLEGWGDRTVKQYKTGARGRPGQNQRFRDAGSMAERILSHQMLFEDA